MITLHIKAIPNSSKSEIMGWLGDDLKVKVSAQPEKGKANKAVIALLSKELGIPKNTIHIDSGQKAQTKVLTIENMDEETLMQSLTKYNGK